MPWTVVSDLIGPPGPAGSQGPPGQQGSQGIQGIQGPQGPAGIGINVKGTVPNSGSLPTTGNQPNDAYTALDTGHMWVWNGTAWTDIGPIQGPIGPAGPTGPGAHTLVVNQFTVPAVGQTIDVTVQDTTWAVANEMVYVEDAGGSGISAAMRITAINGNVLTLLNPSSASGGLGEAPVDGSTYGRQSAAWVHVVPQNGTGATAAVYDNNGAPVLTGYVTPTSPAAAYLQIQPKRASDGSSSDGGGIILLGPSATTGPGQVQLRAGTTAAGFKSFIADPSGSLILPQDPVNPTDAATKQYVDRLRAVSADVGNLATLGSDNLVLVPQSSIWSQRLRSFSTIGNPGFEVDQHLCGTASSANGTKVDRWIGGKSGSMVCSWQQMSAAAGDVVVPGTSFAITSKFLRTTLTTASATLGANDYVQVYQFVEGPQFRELQYDVHSVQLLVRSSVAGLTFGLALTDNLGQSLTLQCTIPSSNTWTLIKLPNLPIFPSAGSFSNAPGAVGYILIVSLAQGSNRIAPSNGAWLSGGPYSGAAGQANFAASPVNSTFDIAFAQHEPGGVCTTLQDKPFTRALEEALRYYEKTYPFATVPGGTSPTGYKSSWQPVANALFMTSTFFKKVMAKAPTVIFYHPWLGTVNAYSYNGSTTAATAVTSVSQLTEYGFGGFVSGGAPAAGSYGYWHYTADTGW